MAVKKVLVYQSKDEQDWEKAKGILAEGGIGFHDWASEEVGACGCGAKLDIRKFGRKEPIPTRIFHIENFSYRGGAGGRRCSEEASEGHREAGTVVRV